MARSIFPLVMFSLLCKRSQSCNQCIDGNDYHREKEQVWHVYQQVTAARYIESGDVQCEPASERTGSAVRVICGESQGDVALACSTLAQRA